MELYLYSPYSLLWREQGRLYMLYRVKLRWEWKMANFLNNELLTVQRTAQKTPCSYITKTDLLMLFRESHSLL